MSTEPIASHTIRHDKPRWRIVSDTVAGQVGQSTVFVGRTSGTYTPAVINNTCFDVYRADRDVMMICQTKATAQGTGGAGDSGAPVFKITDSPDDGDVNLYGILWGGNSTTILYSSVQQIQHSSELGTLRSCDSSLTC